jgi:hypothetical protein
VFPITDNFLFLQRVKARHQPRHGNLLQELEDVGCFVMSDLMIQANYIDILTGTGNLSIYLQIYFIMKRDKQLYNKKV